MLILPLGKVSELPMTPHEETRHEFTRGPNRRLIRGPQPVLKCRSDSSPARGTHSAEVRQAAQEDEAG